MIVEQYIDNLGQSRTTPFAPSFTVDDLDEDYALAMQLQMEEEEQYQALHAREQKSSKRLALFLDLMCSDR